MSRKKNTKRQAVTVDDIRKRARWLGLDVPMATVRGVDRQVLMKLARDCDRSVRTVVNAIRFRAVSPEEARARSILLLGKERAAKIAEEAKLIKLRRVELKKGFSLENKRKFDELRAARLAKRLELLKKRSELASELAVARVKKRELMYAAAEKRRELAAARKNARIKRREVAEAKEKATAEARKAAAAMRQQLWLKKQEQLEQVRKLSNRAKPGSVVYQYQSQGYPQIPPVRLGENEAWLVDGIRLYREDMLEEHGLKMSMTQAVKRALDDTVGARGFKPCPGKSPGAYATIGPLRLTEDSLHLPEIIREAAERHRVSDADVIRSALAAWFSERGYDKPGKRGER